MRDNFFQKGFTLIELMVVIGMISLLSSIIFASLNNARDKAKMAASLQFSSSLLHGLGSEAVGGWNFDEGSGTSTVDDLSGLSNNGSLVGSVTWSNDTPSGKGYSLSFPGLAYNYLSLGNKASLIMGDGVVTVESWIKPEALLGGAREIFFGGGGYGGGIGYGMTLISDGRFSYGVRSDTVASQTITVNIGIKGGEWNHIVAVFDGENNYLQVFLNGVQKHKATITDPGYVGNNSSIFTIGSYSNWTYPFLGLIDTVRVYKRAVQEAEVKQLYTEGLRNHQDFIASNFNLSEIYLSLLNFLKI